MEINCSNKVPVKIISKKDPQKTIETCIVGYVRENYKYRTDLSVKYLDFFSTELYGIFLKFKVTLDTYRVKILINNKKGNTCWERFVTTKELSHILIGYNQTGNTEDVAMLLSELINRTDIKDSFHKNTSLQEEYKAITMAMELLVPYCYTPLLKDKNLTSLQIATLLKVPEYIIDALRKDDYLKKRDKYYN